MNVYDVRTFRYSRTVTLDAGTFAGFNSGPGTVVLTGHGGMKLLRTPPPLVREQRVDIDISLRR
jgi:hypothetical protein